MVDSKQRRILAQEAKQRHGVITFHEEMANGEYRFRLRGADGSAYIRTEAAPQGAWQRAHVHTLVQELYIVQAGWMCLAQEKFGNVHLTRYVAGDHFVVPPNVIHNVYLPTNGVIHTVKFGPPNIDDHDEPPEAQNFTALCSQMSERDVSRALRGNISAENNFDAYKHYDSLIWSVPAWSSAFFILSLNVFDPKIAENIHKLSAYEAESTNSFFYGLITIVIISFGLALFRFRTHQSPLKRWRTSAIISASTITQLVISMQAVIFFYFSLQSLHIFGADAVLAMSMILVVGATVAMEFSLRRAR